MNPANVKFCCNSGCGITSSGGSVPAGVATHWQSAANSPSIVTSGPSPMLGESCFFFNFQEEYLVHHFSPTLGAAPVIARFYVYFPGSLPNDVTTLFSVADLVGNDHAGVNFVASDGTLRAGWRAGSLETASSGIAVVPDQWYCVDVKVQLLSTIIVDIQVDEVAGAQFTRVSGAGAVNAEKFHLGLSGNATGPSVYITNLIISNNASDYPIGPGNGVTLYPNADRTNSVASGVGNGGHRYSAVNDFGKGAGGATNLAAQNVESTAWQSLQNPLSLTTPTNFVANKTGASGAAEYTSFELENLPADVVSINGGMLVMTTHSASTTANNFSFQLNYGSTASVSADLSNTVVTNPVTVVPASTISQIDNAYGLFYSEDVNPDVYLDGFCLEVDYIPEDTGLEGAISSAIFTLTPVALTAAVGGVTKTLTPVALSFVPVALSASVGGVTASISPIVFTLTPVALVPDTSQHASISPATFTLFPQPLSASPGTVTASISPMVVTLTPTALSGSGSGTASRDISPLTLTLTPVALSGSGSGTANTSISPVTLTLTSVSLVSSIGTATGSVSPVTLTLTAVALSSTVGATSGSVSPIVMSFSAVALTTSVGNVSASISPTSLTLVMVEISGDIAAPGVGSISPIVFTLSLPSITTSIGDVQGVISPVNLTLTTVGLTTSVGNAPVSISPITITYGLVALASTVGGTQGSISPIGLTLSAVTLTRSVGNVSASISPIGFVLSVVALTSSTGNSSRSITPVTMTLSMVSVTTSVDNAFGSISPLTFTLVATEITGFLVLPGVGNISPIILTLTPTDLTRSVGPVSSNVSPMLMSFVPTSLTKSVGPVSGSIVPITMSLNVNTLAYSIGNVEVAINPVVMSLIAATLAIAGIGGRPNVWDGASWVNKPVMRWTGTEWTEHPMKVWNGSTWEFV